VYPDIQRGDSVVVVTRRTLRGTIDVLHSQSNKILTTCSRSASTCYGAQSAAARSAAESDRRLKLCSIMRSSLTFKSTIHTGASKALEGLIQNRDADRFVSFGIKFEYHYEIANACSSLYACWHKCIDDLYGDAWG
jgi:hypothetical protein